MQRNSLDYGLPLHHERGENRGKGGVFHGHLSVRRPVYTAGEGVDAAGRLGRGVVLRVPPVASADQFEGEGGGFRGVFVRSAGFRCGRTLLCRYFFHWGPGGEASSTWPATMSSGIIINGRSHDHFFVERHTF